LNIGGLQVGFGTEIQDKISLNIYLSGCKNNKRCDRNKCHNPKLLNFKHGKSYTECAEYITSMLCTNLIECVCLLGGEPLDQDESSLINLIKEIKHVRDIPLYMYSGYDDKDFLIDKKAILGVSEIIYGHYEKDCIKNSL